MADEHVPPQNPASRNSPKAAAKSPDAPTLDAAPGHADCFWNDKKYSDGSTVCDAGQRRECWNGKWVDIGNC
ncbi:hypothetical protein [uncultured Sphingomonas sp.]|uniref:hypothetical protein n=1 Tax=uncultured Sphingomonas sp. TaxID=158754 RepID=UPI0035CB2E69